MSLDTRVVVVLIVMSLLAGPLAPAVRAQQPAQPQPDVFKETMKGADDQHIPRTPGGPSVPPVSRGDDVGFNETFYDVTAGAMTAFLIPGRAITCVTGGVVSAVLMVLTLGTAYRAASGVIGEGCGGKWIVRGEDLQSPGERVPIVHPGDRK